jgi:hypothetical protein
VGNVTNFIMHQVWLQFLLGQELVKTRVSGTYANTKAGHSSSSFGEGI